MSTPVPESFGPWLKQRRDAAGLTQDDLAQAVACSTITLQKMEAGERRPSRQLALLLAARFQIPTDEHEAFVSFARASLSAPAHAPRLPPSAASVIPPTSLPHPLQASTPAPSPWRAAHLRQSNLPQ